MRKSEGRSAESETTDPSLELTVVTREMRKKVAGEHLGPHSGPEREKKRHRGRCHETLQPNLVAVLGEKETSRGKVKVRG